MTRQGFIKDIGLYAQELGTEYNILPSLIIGVACHESNFGKSGLAKEGLNLFGVKGKYEGDSVSMKTWEVKDGTRYETYADFRKYPTYKESMIDFCKLIMNGVSWNKKIYHSVIGVRDWELIIKKFSETPYMTDPDYYDKLHAITSKYELFSYNEATPEAQKEIAVTVNYIEYPDRHFAFGSKGNYVELIQKQLAHRVGDDILIDGHFGELTKAYVMVFQKENDLVPDGSVGRLTWEKLFNYL